jgi:hypothetical protein
MDLIEHLPKQLVSAFLTDLRGRLAPGGVLLIQTPNMGSVTATFNRYYDLSHDFGVTEQSAVALLMSAGFSAGRIEVRPAWNATTYLGMLRQLYLTWLHSLIFLCEGSNRPRIPTKNLIIRAAVD